MSEATHFGPYRLLMALPPARFGACITRRWIALNEREHSSHLVYVLDGWRDRFSIRRFLGAADALALPLPHHPHVLTVGAYSLCARRGCCLVTEYPGDQGGMLSLQDLLRMKNGRMTVTEARRGAVHLLTGLEYLHGRGIADGDLTLDRVLVDPRGCLRIELPGLWPSLTRGTPDPRDDVRAVAHMVHRLLTGVDPSSTGAPAVRGVRGLDPAWDTWMLKGLSPLDGFRTAAEALSALPVRTDADEVRPADAAKPGVVRTLIDRLKGFVPLL